MNKSWNQVHQQKPHGKTAEGFRQCWMIYLEMISFGEQAKDWKYKVSPGGNVQPAARIT